MSGQIHSFLSCSTEDFVSIFDHFDNEETSHRVFISRLPQRRLVEHLDISDIECYWLTELRKIATELLQSAWISLIESETNRIPKLIREISSF